MMARQLGMSLDELDSLRMNLIEKRNAVVSELHEVSKAYNELNDRKRASEMAAGMTEAERAALISVLTTEGKADYEQVGTPGAHK